MIIIKHTIELKLPRLFGKKKNDETEVKTEIKTEVNLENKDYILMGGALVVGITMGYLIGYNRGASRILRNILVLK